MGGFLLSTLHEGGHSHRRDGDGSEAVGEGEPHHRDAGQVGRAEPAVEAAEKRAEHQSVCGGRAAAVGRGGRARPRDCLLQDALHLLTAGAGHQVGI